MELKWQGYYDESIPAPRDVGNGSIFNSWRNFNDFATFIGITALALYCFFVFTMVSSHVTNKTTWIERLKESAEVEAGLKSYAQIDAEN